MGHSAVRRISYTVHPLVTVSTKECVYDNGDCDSFVRDYPDCPMEKLAITEGSSDVVLGNGICESGLLYTNDECGREYGDCDVGQIGQDVIFRGVSSRSSLQFHTRMCPDGSKVFIGMLNTGQNEKYNTTSAGRVKVFYHDSSQQEWMNFGNDLESEYSKEHFGFDMAMNVDGTQVVVGAHKYAGIRGRMKVFRFSPSKNMWLQFGQDLVGSDHGYSYMGHSVDMTEDGSRIAISSPGVASTDSNLFLVGKIQIFEIVLFGDQDLWIKVGEDIYGKKSEEHIGYYYLKFGSLGSHVYFSIGFDDYLGKTAARVYEYSYTSQKWI